MKLTTVVPVFNVGKYIRTCLESLLKQGLEPGEHEILLIDDGSTDDSGRICDEYAAKYPTIFRVFHKPNGGVSSARNLGIREAKGEYIHFMDADDYIVPGGYAFLRDNFLNTTDKRIDYLGFYSVTLDAVARRTFVERNDPSGKIIYEGDIENFYRGDKYFSLIFVGLYGRQMISDIEFDTGLRIGEDIKFNLDFVLKNPNIVLTDCSLYRYAIREGSAIGSRSPKRMRDAVKGYERIIKQVVGAKSEHPEMYSGLDAMIHYEMVPFLSRILSSDMTGREFKDLRKRLIEIGVLPLEVKFKYDSYVNRIFSIPALFPLMRDV